MEKMTRRVLLIGSNDLSLQALMDEEVRRRGFELEVAPSASAASDGPFAFKILELSRTPSADLSEASLGPAEEARAAPILFIVPSHDAVPVCPGALWDVLVTPVNPALLRGKLALLMELALAREAAEEAVRERDTVETLLRIGMSFASQLDAPKLVQYVTDEATRLTGAAFGAYFHNVPNAEGRYGLFTLSGAHKEEFASYPPVRPTPLFGATFGGRTVRIDDVKQSPLYGKNPPHKGMPEGHVPVSSYLATPVRSRSGQVWGALFLGHSEPGRFTQAHERIAEGLAAQAAIALDNAHLFSEARDAVRRRDDFLSLASHELRTPLTALNLSVGAMESAASQRESSPLWAERVLTHTTSAGRQVRKLATLVENLLDVSRISAGRLALSVEELDLVELVRSAVAGFSMQAEKVGCELRLASDPRVAGRWDRFRLEQLMTNLISNAIKYGTGNPIDIEVRAEGGDARLVVADHGIGIAPEFLPRIFGRFERGVSERHYGGLGLGLFIARQVVEAHGGTIRVDSTPGHGAAFTVLLPRDGAS